MVVSARSGSGASSCFGPPSFVMDSAVSCATSEKRSTSFAGAVAMVLPSAGVDCCRCACAWAVALATSNNEPSSARTPVTARRLHRAAYARNRRRRGNGVVRQRRDRQSALQQLLDVAQERRLLGTD